MKLDPRIRKLKIPVKFRKRTINEKIAAVFAAVRYDAYSYNEVANLCKMHESTAKHILDMLLSINMVKRVKQTEFAKIVYCVDDDCARDINIDDIVMYVMNVCYPPKEKKEAK